MAVTFTIDASVYLNAFNPYESGSEQSRNFLKQLEENATPMIVPALLLPEIAAAIRRGRDDPDLAKQFALTLSRLPNLVLIPLDLVLAQQAMEIAADAGLRGSDAVYVAVALRFGSRLVTLDKEQRERTADLTEVEYPGEAAANLGDQSARSSTGGAAGP